MTRIAVVLGLLVTVSVLRLAIDAIVPGVTPFALMYPAVLLATLAAGWISGATVDERRRPAGLVRGDGPALVVQAQHPPPRR